jgi:probable F420-dependent oxidoreductase
MECGPLRANLIPGLPPPVEPECGGAQYAPIAVQLQPQHAEYSAIRDAVIHADEMGVDIAYTWDHFHPLSGDADGLHFECWTMLAAWAEATTNIEIGSLVTCNSYRNPNLLADMARTIGHVSNGRLILGIGPGWFERDYEEYGYDYRTAQSRPRDLDRNLPLIRERWAKLHPAPTRKIPIPIGGGGEKVTLRIASEHADVWHGFGDLATVKHKVSVLNQWCRKAGRDPHDIRKSSGWPKMKAENIDEADALRDAGVSDFTLGYDGTALDMPGLGDWLAWRDSANATPRS